MSESQQATIVVRLTGALTTGLDEAAVFALEFLAPEATVAAAILSGTNVLAFGAGEGLATGQLGAAFTGATVGEAAAIAMGLALAPETPVIVVGVATAIVALVANSAAQSLYGYLEANGNQILAAEGQNEVEAGQAELAMGLAIRDGISSIANNIANSVSSLATYIGQAELNNENAQAAVSQAIDAWIGQEVTSIGTTLGGVFQAIGGTTAEQTSAQSDFAATLQQAYDSLSGWSSNIMANPPTPSNPNIPNDFDDPQFVSQFTASLAGLDPTAADAALTALTTLSNQSETLSSGLVIDLQDDGSMSFGVPDSQTGGFDTFTVTNDQESQEIVTSETGQTDQQIVSDGSGEIAVTTANGYDGTITIDVSNSVIDIASGLSVIVQGINDTVLGTSGTLDLSGMDNTATLGADAIINDSGIDDLLAAGSDSTLTFSGTGDDTAGVGADSSITIDSGGGYNITASDSAIDAQAGTAGSITGSNNDIEVNVGSYFTVNGGDNTVSNVQSGDIVYLSDTGNASDNVSGGGQGAGLILDNNSQANVDGSDYIVNLGTDVQVSISGSTLYLSATGDDVQGSDNRLFGSSETFDLNGNDNTAFGSTNTSTSSGSDNSFFGAGDIDDDSSLPPYGPPAGYSAPQYTLPSGNAGYSPQGYSPTGYVGYGSGYGGYGGYYGADISRRINSFGSIGRHPAPDVTDVSGQISANAAS